MFYAFNGHYYTTFVLFNQMCIFVFIANRFQDSHSGPSYPGHIVSDPENSVLKNIY